MLNQNELFSFSILTIKEQNIQFSFFVKFYFISDIAQKKKCSADKNLHPGMIQENWLVLLHVLVYTKITITQICRY